MAHGVVDAGGRQPHSERQLARLEGLQPRPGSKASFRISFRGLGGHLFDVHAARRGGHEDRLTLDAVQHDAEVQLALDGQRLFDQQALHDAAFRAGLVRHQRMPSICRATISASSTLGDLHFATLTPFSTTLSASSGPAREYNFAGAHLAFALFVYMESRLPHAPSLHPAMKYAQPARVDLKMRTLFNLLGPLANPAWANVQLIGAFSEAAAELMAGALAQLGIQRAFVVHGSDGLDEITTTGPTLVFEVQPGQAVRRTLHPRDFEVAVARAEDLRGGSVEENVAIARAVLSGAAGPARDIVVANAAAALFLAEAAPGLVQAARCAADSIDSGAALRKLHSLVEFTRAVTPE
jgi:hypothetical protein